MKKIQLRCLSKKIMSILSDHWWIRLLQFNSQKYFFKNIVKHDLFIKIVSNELAYHKEFFFQKHFFNKSYWKVFLK